MKKLFIVSSVLLFLVLIFLGIYNFSFKKEDSVMIEQTKTDNAAIKENVIENKSAKIIAVTKEAVIGAVMDKKKEEIKYIDSANGFVWKMDSAGNNKQQLSNTKIAGLKNVFWSPDQSKALIVSEENGKIIFSEYDFLTKKIIVLKNGLDSAVWDNLGNKIFYKYYDSKIKKRTLNIANPDGSGWQKIADVEARNLSIAPVPMTSIVSFWNFPSVSEQTSLQTVGVTGGDAEVLFSGKFGADYLWAPNGTRALVSSLENKESKITTLGIISMEGKYQDLNIPTIVSKCVWSLDSKTIFYALPGGIPSDAIMPDDYQKNKFLTNDTFWKIDVTTGEKSRIIDTSEISGKFDSINLFLSTTENALYFNNKADNKLYRMEL